ncbi:MAG: protein-disulfide reductase DsbD domain-containing protein, partial [Hyphomicrobiaceae bacterium]
MRCAHTPLFAMILSGFLAVCAAPAALAEGLASDWSKGIHSRARLTAAYLLGVDNAVELYAGVDIQLDEKWKTYWHSPGDGGGLPPEFDWSRSQNVKSARVLYPVPRLYKDPFGYSVGYKRKVLFPVSVVPVDRSKPVWLRLSVLYGVCEEICIPAEADLALDVAPNARAAISVQRDLMAALDSVPKVAGESDTGLAVISKRAVLSGDDPHLAVTARAPAGTRDVDLFAAARDGKYVPLAKRVEQSADGQTV